MDTIFLTILAMCVVVIALGFASAVLWVIERTTWKHVSLALTFSTTIGSIVAAAYAYWQTYHWWTLAIIVLTIAHGFYVSWYMSNSEKLNRPIYRVGGGHASPRLHR